MEGRGRSEFYLFNCIIDVISIEVSLQCKNLTHIHAGTGCCSHRWGSASLWLELCIRDLWSCFKIAKQLTKYGDTNMAFFLPLGILDYSIYSSPLAICHAGQF